MRIFCEFPQEIPRGENACVTDRDMHANSKHLFHVMRTMTMTDMALTSAWILLQIDADMLRMEHWRALKCTLAYTHVQKMHLARSFSKPQTPPLCDTWCLKTR
jgi:hypothetical protein